MRALPQSVAVGCALRGKHQSGALLLPSPASLPMAGPAPLPLLPPLPVLLPTPPLLLLALLLPLTVPLLLALESALSPPLSKLTGLPLLPLAPLPLVEALLPPGGGEVEVPQATELHTATQTSARRSPSGMTLVNKVHSVVGVSALA
jgi:hypothetical protein